MNYHVTWNGWAENDLAAVWLAATDRDAVADAAAWLDQHLARHPLDLGEEWGVVRPPDRRSPTTVRSGSSTR